MANNVPQTAANHTRFDPAFHFFVAPVSAVTVVWMIVKLVQHFDIDHVALLVLAIAGFVAVFKIRRYALKAQDRIIRLEERLRLAALLHGTLQSRIGELKENQLIALRFASDAELPALVEQALAQHWKSGEIKKAIRTWRPDYFRI
jgi:hypothetical protein